MTTTQDNEPQETTKEQYNPKIDIDEIISKIMPKLDNLLLNRLYEASEIFADEVTRKQRSMEEEFIAEKIGDITQRIESAISSMQGRLRTSRRDFSLEGPQEWVNNTTINQIHPLLSVAMDTHGILEDIKRTIINKEKIQVMKGRG